MPRRLVRHMEKIEWSAPGWVVEAAGSEGARDCGRLVALAGSMDLEAIARLKAWHPDVFAVRGAACAAGDRLGPIDAGRVARLADAVHSGLAQMSNRTP